MDRRTVLKGIAGLCLGGPASLFAAPSSDAKLLVVFLRGAYDAANLLVPIHSDFYYKSRPNIAIARPSADENSALLLNGQWGLHPALKTSLYPYWARGQLGFIPYAGTDDVSRSHFETQERIETGLAPELSLTGQSGFMNRLAAELSGKAPFAFTRLEPSAFRGPVVVPNLSPKDARYSKADQRQIDLIEGMYRDTGLQAKVKEGTRLRTDDARDMQQEMEAARQGASKSQGFALEARGLAALLRERYDIGFVDLDGWDTHVGQGAARGQLANRFDELGRGLAALAEGMGPAWNKTVVVVISEFGRTLRENGNRGTDHGHGTVYWVMGGGVKGGHIFGEQVPVSEQSLFQNRDYPVLNEYRAVLGGLFGRMFGLGPSQLARVFPGAHPRDLGLV